MLPSTRLRVVIIILYSHNIQTSLYPQNNQSSSKMKISHLSNMPCITFLFSILEESALKGHPPTILLVYQALTKRFFGSRRGFFTKRKTVEAEEIIERSRIQE